MMTWEEYEAELTGKRKEYFGDDYPKVKFRKRNTPAFAHAVSTSQGEELANSTCFEAVWDGESWDEFEDSYGDLHYGR